MHVSFNHGIHLTAADLWLDPHRPKPFAVVTHAHSDHMQPHDEALTTPATAAMMRLRGAPGCRFHEVGFSQPVELGSARITFYPAGHVLGSAQVLVERNGQRLLYSGDFKLRPGRSAETVEVPRADIVIMETTFGQPRYRFPETEQVMDDIRVFCRNALRGGQTPVLFCYSLGKGQEVLAGLRELELPIYLQDEHWQMASLYTKFGVRFPPFRRYQAGQLLDGVLLCASGCRRSRWFAHLQDVRTAYISGWALDSGACYRFGTDAAFPLSDHADYDDLHEYVRRTGAGMVYTVHGFDKHFAADLRGRGIEAQPLRRPDAPSPVRTSGVVKPARRVRQSLQSRELAGQMKLF